jgi:acetyl esterase/lipase
MMRVMPLLRSILLHSALISAIALTFPCVIRPVSFGASAPTSIKNGHSVVRNIVYTPADWPAPVMGDLYRPATARPAPAVLLVHGGGWTGKDGRWQMNPIAKKLAKRGYVVLNVTYRLAPRWIYPAPVEDLKQALRWMRTNAADAGIDPQRIAVYGYSAGGYLAALTAMDEATQIRAIVAGGAPSDLTLYPGGDLVPQFLGGRKHEIPERFYEASPVNHVTRKTPPVFLYHGGADRLVPPEHAWEFKAALERNQVPHELYWIEGRDHIAAFLLPGRSVDLAVDFLDRCLAR